MKTIDCDVIRSGIELLYKYWSLITKFGFELQTHLAIVFKEYKMFELTLQPPQSPKIGFEDDRQSVPETSTLTVEDDRLSYMSLARKVSEYQDSKPFFSIEFFPPRSEKGATSLVKLLESYREGDAHFLDITWHVAGNPGRETPTSSITIAGVALNYCCFDTMLHIICIGLTKQDLKRHLERAKTLGIRNLLALRGDKHG